MLLSLYEARGEMLRNEVSVETARRSEDDFVGVAVGKGDGGTEVAETVYATRGRNGEWRDMMRT